MLEIFTVKCIFSWFHSNKKISSFGFEKWRSFLQLSLLWKLRRSLWLVEERKVRKNIARKIKGLAVYPHHTLCNAISVFSYSSFTTRRGENFLLEYIFVLKMERKTRTCCSCFMEYLDDNIAVSRTLEKIQSPVLLKAESCIVMFRIDFLVQNCVDEQTFTEVNCKSFSEIQVSRRDFQRLCKLSLSS